MPQPSSFVRRLSACLLVATLAGCATPFVPPAPASLLQDAQFAPPPERPDAQRLFALSPAMQAYAAGELASKLRQRGPLHGLVDALYERRGLQLEYDSLRTRTAAEAFEARAGNCLSLVLMTAAFAKAIDLQVSYRRIGVDAQWRRVGDVYLASGHVNLELSPAVRSSRAASSQQEALTIGFLPPAQFGAWPVEEIDEARIVSTYMNNRAAKTLAQGQIDQAYWWAREALLQAPAELALGRAARAREHLRLAHELSTSPAEAARLADKLARLAGPRLP